MRMSKKQKFYQQYQQIMLEEMKRLAVRRMELTKEMKETKERLRKWNKIFLWISPFMIIFLGILIYYVSNRFYETIIISPKDYFTIAIFGIVTIFDFGLLIYWCFMINYYRKRVKQDNIDIAKEIVEELTDKNGQEN